MKYLKSLGLGGRGDRKAVESILLVMPAHCQGNMLRRVLQSCKGTQDFILPTGKRWEHFS